MTENITEGAATEPTPIVEYRTATAALALLREKYAAPFDATTAAGMAAAKAARAEIRGLRGALEKTRAEIKAPVLAQGQLIDAEAKRINAALLAIEGPIDAAIRAEESRKAEEKAARERAEAARIAALQAKIDAIRHRALAVAHRDAAAIRAALADARAFEPDPDEFVERWPDAMKAVGEARQALASLLAEREEREERQAEEEAQRQAEREELARLRAGETARQQSGAKARTEQEARRRVEATAKPGRTRKPAEADPLDEIKNALAAGTMAGADAIDCAYQLGFKSGAQAARQAA